MKILLVFLLFLSFGLKASAKQNAVILKILDSAQNCTPNIYFSETEINSKDRFYAYYVELQKLFPNEILEGLAQSKDLNLMPINRCVLKGNKNYPKELNLSWLKKLQVKSIISTDYLSNTLNSGKNSLNYVFLPIHASGYQKKQESIQSLLLAFEYLAKASPTQKVYINCFSGKYQSGLVVALYQFLQEYAFSSQETCQNLATKQDLAFNQMLNVANQGLFSYNLPNGFKKFYVDFGKAVCEEQSEEFLQKLKDL